MSIRMSLPLLANEPGANIEAEAAAGWLPRWSVVMRKAHPASE